MKYDLLADLSQQLTSTYMGPQIIAEIAKGMDALSNGALSFGLGTRVTGFDVKTVGGSGLNGGPLYKSIKFKKGNLLVDILIKPFGSHLVDGLPVNGSLIITDGKYNKYERVLDGTSKTGEEPTASCHSRVILSDGSALSRIVKDGKFVARYWDREGTAAFMSGLSGIVHDYEYSTTDVQEFERLSIMKPDDFMKQNLFSMENVPEK